MEAGVMVLANNGQACIDEFDKMSNEDKGCMHQAMEQQVISIAKAGINVNLKTKCSVTAAANPKLGRFDEFLPIAPQIDMPTPLITRFDLILPITDKPNRERDTKLSKHILETHKNPNRKEIIPIYSKDIIRKHVAYAKQHCTPKLTDDAIDYFQKYYVDLRNTNDESIPFTPRQLEAFVRLAEASARVRLSNKVTLVDAKRSINICEQYFRRFGIDRETGKLDIDVIETGISGSQHKRMNIIIETISTLCNTADGLGAAFDDIIAEAEIRGIDANKTEKSLERLIQERQIVKCAKGNYKING